MPFQKTKVLAQFIYLFIFFKVRVFTYIFTLYLTQLTSLIIFLLNKFSQIQIHANSRPFFSSFLFNDSSVKTQHYLPLIFPNNNKIITADHSEVCKSNRDIDPPFLPKIKENKRQRSSPFTVATEMSSDGCLLDNTILIRWLGSSHDYNLQAIQAKRWVGHKKHPTKIKPRWWS